MKIIITESQLKFLISEGEKFKDIEDNSYGMRGTKRFMGMDYFSEEAIYKVFEVLKAEKSDEYPNISNFEQKIKRQNKIKRRDRPEMLTYLSEFARMCDSGDWKDETALKNILPRACYTVIDSLQGDNDNVFSLSYPHITDIFLYRKDNFPKQPVQEKWSNKYKRSIDCNNPKGFSQRAHCQGRKKKKNN